MELIYFSLFLFSLVSFWLLIFRVIAAFLRLDPYNSLIQFLYQITEPLVKPFRRGIFLRPSQVDLALIPPIAISVLVMLIFGSNN